jgi:hypothetical protein
MHIRLVLGAALAAVVLMAWGFVFWTVTPFPYQMMAKIPHEEAIVQALQEQSLETGTYFLPFPDKDAMSGANTQAQEALMKMHASGPLLQLSYRKEGLDPTSPAVYLQGMAHMFVSALLIGGLMLLALPSLPTFGRRWLFVALAGTFAAIAIELANPIWFHNPWKFALYETGFNIAGWVLAGLVLGAVIKPRSKSPVETQPFGEPHHLHRETGRKEAQVQPRA